MKRAVAYVRVSGESQAEAGGPDRQREKIAASAAARGFEIADWYEDLGVSGAKDLEDRPGLGSLLLAVEHNGFEAVFVERLDRLARDLVVQERIIADFQGRGFTLISADEGDDLLSNDPSRKLIRQIFGAIAEYDRCTLNLKLAAGKRRAKSQGKRAGGRLPYGVRAGEKAILARMLELRAQGLWHEQVAERLNAEGLKPRYGDKGARWHGRSVGRILNRAGVA